MPDFDLSHTVGVVAGIIAAVAVLRHWPRAGKWGMNLNPVSCPRCQAPAPRIRRPANRRQMLWGGWTCTQCGIEYDKYGEEIAVGTSPDDARDDHGHSGPAPPAG